MSQNNAAMVAELDGCDQINVTKNGSDYQAHIIGCAHTLELWNQLKSKYGKDISHWELPLGNDHSALLLREIILKTKGEWKYPYTDAELCHCRSVPTRVVDQAIVSGAHTPEQVSRMTSASTACATCRPDVEKIIAFRLAK